MIRIAGPHEFVVDERPGHLAPTARRGEALEGSGSLMSVAFLAPSPMELIVIAVIALIVLGPNRLPEAARSVGRGIREMRDSFQGVGDDEDDDDGGSDRRVPEDPFDVPGGGGAGGHEREPEGVGASGRSG